MLVESYLLPPSPEYPLFTTARRYWLKEFDQNAADPLAQTLILLHSTSFHKETWEPTLEDLFALVSQRGSSAPVIREAWVIECPNHGESGQINHQLLKEPGFQDFSCHRYAEAAHHFLTAARSSRGQRVDFRRRNLVGIGHSLGANAMLILQNMQPVFTFSKLVIIEPMVTAAGPFELESLREQLVQRAQKRTKLWSTHEEVRDAYNNPARRGSKWDPRVLDTFLKYALHWKEEHKKFGLSCTPEQEVAMYLDKEGPTKPVEDLNQICHRIPVHLILGDVPDLIPKRIHEALSDPKSGRRFASVNWMKNAGHLIPQEVPTALSALIFDTLLTTIKLPIPPYRL